MSHTSPSRTASASRRFAAATQKTGQVVLPGDLCRLAPWTRPPLNGSERSYPTRSFKRTRAQALAAGMHHSLISACPHSLLKIDHSQDHARPGPARDKNHVGARRGWATGAAGGRAEQQGTLQGHTVARGQVHRYAVLPRLWSGTRSHVERTEWTRTDSHAFGPRSRRQGIVD